MSKEKQDDKRLIKTPSGLRLVGYEKGKQMIAAGLAWEPSPKDIWEYIRENTSAPSDLRERVERLEEIIQHQQGLIDACGAILFLLPEQSAEKPDVLAEIRRDIMTNLEVVQLAEGKFYRIVDIDALLDRHRKIK